MADEKITLGRREWTIPELSARRIIKFSCIVMSWGKLGKKPEDMSTDELEQIYDAVLIGLQQGAPTLTKDEFMEMPITVAKAMEAIRIISKQAGLELTPVPPEAGPESGSIPPNSKPNGMTSSPTS